MRFRWPGYLLWGATVLWACDRTRHAECDTLIREFNPVLHEIAQVEPADAAGHQQSCAALRELAQRYEQLAQSASRLKLANDALRAHAASYQQLAQQAAGICRELAEAIAAGDAKRQRAAEQQFARVVEQQRQVVSQINSICGH
jgi:uncharacterized protein YukE